MTIQPIFMIVGGVLAGVVGLRGTIAGAGILLMCSSLLLPWQTLQRHQQP